MKFSTCQMCGKTVLPIGTARKNGVKFDDDWKDRKACWKSMKQEEAVSNKWQKCKYDLDD